MSCAWSHACMFSSEVVIIQFGFYIGSEKNFGKFSLWSAAEGIRQVLWWHSGARVSANMLLVYLKTLFQSAASGISQGMSQNARNVETVMVVWNHFSAELQMYPQTAIESFIYSTLWMHKFNNNKFWCIFIYWYAWG